MYIKVSIDHFNRTLYCILMCCQGATLAHTVSERQCHTPIKEKRRFLYFNHLSKEFLEQMTPHLKALILGV